MEATNKQKYIEWIDVAKGLGIYLIVCGHVFYEAPSRLYHHITYSFLSAFFFVLSGFVFSLRKNPTFLQFLKNKVIRILVPTILFVFIGLVFGMLINGERDPIVLLRYFFYYDGTYEYNIPCWFFISLFFAYIICYLLRVSEQKMYVKITIMMLFYLLGYLAYKQLAFIEFNKNPFVRFGIDRVFIITGFFIFGNILRDIYNKIDVQKHLKYLIIALIPLLALWILFGYFLNTTTSIYQRKLDNYWSFIASSMFGCPAFFIISMLLCYIKVLVPVFKAWGKNTILIACTHYTLRWSRLLLRNIGAAMGLTGTHWISLIIPIYVLILMMLYIPVGYLVDKYLPYLTGVEPVFYKSLIEKRHNKKEIASS